MTRLASFLTALWLSSAAAHPGFGSFISQTVTGVKNQVVSEVQAGTDPLGKTIGFVGDGICNGVKPIVGVAYENYDKEPDMSKLTLVFMDSAKTVIYNLTQAAEVIPKETWYDPSLPLKIYLHGFTDNPSKSSFQTMKNAFFALEATEGKVNILALDASSLIAFFYLRATTMVRFIGQKLGETIAALVNAGMDPKKIHLIGHSLGAHTAGFAGKSFFSQTGSLVSRISGLDPAGPCFGQVDPSVRITYEDAEFVDIIHSDAGVYGMDEQIGHVDFFPNSGSEQPNCLLQTCSHSRAWELYAESILKPELLIGVKCDTYYDFRHDQCKNNVTSVMGYHTPADTRGTFYLQTLGEEPFGIGTVGLTYRDTAAVTFVSNGIVDIFHG